MPEMAIGFSGAAAASDADLHAQLASLVAGGGAPGLDQIISACPRVLTKAWQSQSGIPDDALTALRAYRVGLDEGTRSWPWGIGPLEQLFEGLDRAFGLEVAQGLAASPLVTRSLSRPYLESACAFVDTALHGSDLQRARRFNEILLAAVEQDAAEDSARCQALTWLTWLNVAKLVLGELADEALFASASDTEARLLSLAESLGDMELACYARYLFAGVLTAPYMTATEQKQVEYIRRWLWRAADSGLPLTDTIPHPNNAFELAEGRLRQALRDAIKGRFPVESGIRAYLALVLFWRYVTWGQGTPTPTVIGSIADEAQRALTALGPAELGERLEMQKILSALGRKGDTADLESICREPIDDQVARYGVHETCRIVTGTVELLTAWQPDLALSYLASLEVYQRRLPERLRVTFLQLHASALLGGNTAENARSVLAELPAGRLADSEQLLEILRKRAHKNGWAPAEALRCALFVASAEFVVPDAVLPLQSSVTRLAPLFAAQHRDAISFLAASKATDIAETVYSLKQGEAGPESEGDPVAAASYIAEALVRFCDMELADAALECLAALHLMVTFGGPGIAEIVIRALPGRLGGLEAIGGERALREIATFIRTCVAHLLDEGAGGAVLVALLLGKGHAFASAQAMGATFNVARDEDAIGLLLRIRETSLTPGSGADIPGSLDEHRLLMPYQAAQEELPEVNAAQLLGNLQHSFDELVERKILTALDRDTLALRTWRWSVDGVIESLPSETALMILYLCTEPPERMVTAIITAEQVYLPYQMVSTPGDAYAAAFAEYSAYELMQMSTYVVRERMQEDPGPRIVDRDCGFFLEDTTLLGRAVDVLADLHGRGYRHLIVVPHGPLHYFPIHLFGPLGKPLSADWLVTFQPSPLGTVTGDDQPRRRRAARAVALGIDFRDYPGRPARFEPLEGVAEEVRAVAAAVRGRPVLNEQVTQSAIAEALQQARWVHIATHGLANAYAPCFDALVVWPDATGRDRLAAYELLDMDLRGLELVTLSACETALGRFDIADNLRGLTATLLRAGARAVIGTLWPVETQTSTDFFAALYAELGTDATIGDAYLTAQRSTRHTHPQYRDWGAFVLLGSWADGKGR